MEVVAYIIMRRVWRSIVQFYWYCAAWMDVASRSCKPRFQSLVACVVVGTPVEIATRTHAVANCLLVIEVLKLASPSEHLDCIENVYSPHAFSPIERSRVPLAHAPTHKTPSRKA